MQAAHGKGLEAFPQSGALQKEAVEPVKFFWYPWVGIVERGNPTTLSLYPMGVTHSTGEPRIPPISSEFWTPLGRAVFPEGANVVQMTDGAQTYLQVTRFSQISLFPFLFSGALWPCFGGAIFLIGVPFWCQTSLR